QSEQLRQQVLASAEAVGGEHGFVEGAMGVLERISPGQLECAIEGAQPALECRERFVADALNFSARVGDGVNSFRLGSLRPGESVEHRCGSVAEVRLQFAALRHEPEPMGGRLQYAEAVVVVEGERFKRVVWPDVGI